jgi:hypothetical protein
MLNSYVRGCGVRLWLLSIQQAQSEPEAKFEQSETLLYKNVIMEEMGDISSAFANLAVIDKDVVDRICFYERKGMPSQPGILPVHIMRYPCHNNWKSEKRHTHTPPPHTHTHAHTHAHKKYTHGNMTCVLCS